MKRKTIITILPITILLFAVAFLLGRTEKNLSKNLPYEKVQELSKNGPSVSEYLFETPAGSCNLIESESVCFEYYGPYWEDGNVELICDKPGVYDEGLCPETKLGGCRITTDGSNGLTTWYYDYGGAPFTGEGISSAGRACVAVPGGEWIFTR